MYRNRPPLNSLLKHIARSMLYERFDFPLEFKYISSHSTIQRISEEEECNTYKL